MEKLASIVARNGLHLILEHTRILSALVASDGSMIDWNPAVSHLSNFQPKTGALHDLIVIEQRKHLLELLQQKKDKTVAHQVKLDFVTDGQGGLTRYDCLLLPLPEGPYLFIAEPASDTSRFHTEIQRLADDLTKTTIALEEATRRLKIKEIELKAVIAQAEEVSHVDQLTCLPNRRQVIKTLQSEVIRAERYMVHLSISMIDIDHFKKINDSYGHTVGDQALFQLANILQENVRHPDTVGRYGGEEFLVVLPNTRLKQAAEQAARLSMRIREAEINVGEMLRLTVSIGVAEYRHGQENWQKLLSRADMALYDAKNAGRDRWAISE